jgi:hypothetical protein
MLMILICSFPSDIGRLRSWKHNADLGQSTTRGSGDGKALAAKEKRSPIPVDSQVAAAILSPVRPAPWSWLAAQCRRGRSLPASMWCGAAHILVIAMYLRCHCASTLDACTPNPRSWSAAPHHRGRLNQALGWRVKGNEFDLGPPRSSFGSSPLCMLEKGMVYMRKLDA